MTKGFTFMSDAGHGWLKVPTQELIELGITPSMISTFSYYDAKHFYLEEDCDLRVFVKAYQKKYGVEPTIKYAKPAKGQSSVRNKNRHDGFRGHVFIV